MKTKLFIVLFFSSLAKFAFAQNMIQEDKPYKWSISAAINSVEAQMDQMLFDTWVAPQINFYENYGNKQNKSISASIIPKYQIADDIFLRIEFGVTNINLISHFNGIGDTLTQQQGQALGSPNLTVDQFIKQKIYRYLAGIQWNFMKKKYIEVYCGASLNYFNYSEMQWKQYIATNDTLPKFDHTSYVATTPGGFATGVGAFSGFTIYLHKQVSLGGEFSYSLLYYKLGGMQSGVNKRDNSVWSAPLTLQWSNANNASEGIQFSKVMPSLNLTIRF